MTEEEDDYMSDVFLLDVPDSTPSLVKSRAVKRTHELEKKKALLDERNKRKNKPISEIESKRRNLGLSEPISSDNKGFKLLSKMGFEPGKGLGKKGDGSVAPIDLQVKANRKGLGRDAMIAERLEKIRAKVSTETLEEYRDRMKEKSSDKQIEIDLKKGQKLCYQLDTSQGVTEPNQDWFWPPSENNEEENDADDESSENSEPEMNIGEQLAMLTKYLREFHFYCQWCGTQYDDSMDLKNSCPGDSRDQH